MKSPQPRRSQPLDQINITPFVDVCLVILVIFMVVTPMLVPGHPVRLPEATNPSPQPQDPHAVTLSVDAGGALYMGDRRVDLSQISHALGEVHAENPGCSVRMMGDGRVSFGEVKPLLRATQEAGFTGIALIIKQRSDSVQAATRAAESDARPKEVSREH
jgi:biopolymer transport protein TolR